jgi:hypothetical protein
VFEVFIPQLLLYPNPSDPLNGEAAALMMRDKPAYELRVKGSHFFHVFLIRHSALSNSGLSIYIFTLEYMPFVFAFLYLFL